MMIEQYLMSMFTIQLSFISQIACRMRKNSGKLQTRTSEIDKLGAFGNSRHSLNNWNVIRQDLIKISMQEVNMQIVVYSTQWDNLDQGDHNGDVNLYFPEDLGDSI